MVKQQNKKMPEIRFQGLEGEWEEKTLGELGNATSGTAIESEFDKKGQFKVISIGSYSENSTYTDQEIRVAFSEKTEKRILRKNDLAMVLNDKTASGRIIGRVLLIENSNMFVYNQRTQRIEPFLDKYDPQFLYQLLNAPLIRKQIIDQSQGNTQIYVNWSVIKDLIYVIPSKDEQSQIGAYFAELDRMIGLHQQKHEKLVTLKKTMLKKMFPQNGASTPEIRFKGFSEPWEEKALGEILSPYSFKPYVTEPVFLGEFEVIQQGDNPVVGTANGVPFENFKAVVLFGDHTLSLYKPKGPFFVASDGVKILGNTMELDGDYFYALLTSYKPPSEGYKRHLNILQKIEVLVTADLNEQQKIGTYFRQLDEMIAQRGTQVEKLKQIKAVCLGKMFV